MSQGSSIWVHEEPKLAIEAQSLRHQPVQTSVQDSQKIELVQHVHISRDGPQPEEKDIKMLSREDDPLRNRPRAGSGQGLNQLSRKSAMVSQPPRLDTAVGQKRTSSGHIKTPSSSTSPHEANAQGYSRTESGSSQASPRKSPHISQVSASRVSCFVKSNDFEDDRPVANPLVLCHGQSTKGLGVQKYY